MLFSTWCLTDWEVSPLQNDDQEGSPHPLSFTALLFCIPITKSDGSQGEDSPLVNPLNPKSQVKKRLVSGRHQVPLQ